MISETQRLRNVIAANKDLLAAAAKKRQAIKAKASSAGRQPSQREMDEIARHDDRYRTNIRYLQERIQELNKAVA
jgi:polyhydroxyalkanoate synthesis regulator phasin